MNLDSDPQEVLHFVELETLLWESAQEETQPPKLVLEGLISSNPENLDFFCYVDGSWKETYIFSGLGWHCVCADAVKSIIGARNLQRTFSPLYSELEALIWVMHCLLEHQKTEITFATDSTELVKMVSSPTN